MKKVILGPVKKSSIRTVQLLASIGNMQLTGLNELAALLVTWLID